MHVYLFARGECSIGVVVEKQLMSVFGKIRLDVASIELGCCSIAYI